MLQKRMQNDSNNCFLQTSLWKKAIFNYWIKIKNFLKK